MSQDIFATIENDHDQHRQLLDALEQTSGDSQERRELFEAFTKDVKSHAAAEEQALYAAMMKEPSTTDETRHSVAEHQELNEALNDLAATDMSSPGWLTKFKALAEEYRHHIEEEEEDHFPNFKQELNKKQRAELGEKFDERKRAEKSSAEVTPRAKSAAKA